MIKQTPRSITDQHKHYILVPLQVDIAQRQGVLLFFRYAVDPNTF